MFICNWLFYFHEIRVAEQVSNFEDNLNKIKPIKIMLINDLIKKSSFSIYSEHLYKNTWIFYFIFVYSLEVNA
jgi:hypothetical protein